MLMLFYVGFKNHMYTLLKLQGKKFATWELERNYDVFLFIETFYISLPHLSLIGWFFVGFSENKMTVWLLRNYFEWDSFETRTFEYTTKPVFSLLLESYLWAYFCSARRQ